MGKATDVMHSKIAAFNAQDANEVMRLYSHDTVLEVPGAPVLRGRDQVLAYFSGLWEAFPDVKLTVTRVVEEGSVVVIRGRAEGTHQGTLRTPAGDIPPTGRGMELAFSDHYEVQGGVVVSNDLHFDRLALLEQLGVAPAPAPS